MGKENACSHTNLQFFFFDIAGDVVQSQANFDNFLKNKNPIEKWKPHLKSAGMKHQYKLI